MSVNESNTNKVINLPKDNVFPASQVSQSDVFHARRSLVAGKDSLAEISAIAKRIETSLTTIRELASRLGADGATPFTRRPRAAESVACCIDGLMDDAKTLRQYVKEVNNDIDEAGQYLSKPTPVAPQYMQDSE